MKKWKTLLLLSPFVLLFIFVVFYSMIYAGEPADIIDVYNNDNATYQVNIIINGQNNSYVMQPNGSIEIPKEDPNLNTYKIEVFINGNLENSNNWDLSTYETVLCSVDNGKLDVGLVSV